MADKNKNQIVAADENQITAAKKENTKKGKKTSSQKEKKPGFFARVWKKIKEIFSELKKVTWPTLPRTVKQTGVVIGVTLFFVVVIGAFNALCLFLYTLVTGVDFKSFF